MRLKMKNRDYHVHYCDECLRIIRSKLRPTQKEWERFIHCRCLELKGGCKI